MDPPVGGDSSDKNALNVSVKEATSSNVGDQASLGLDRAVAQDNPRWPRIRYAFREPISEFFGVFTLIIFGDGVVAQVVLSKGQKGDYQSISWGYVRLFYQC